jgi:hypothetical protein
VSILKHNHTVLDRQDQALHRFLLRNSDAGYVGYVDGGRLLEWIDKVAFEAAARWSAVPIAAKHSGDQIGVLSIDCLADAYADGHASPILEGSEIEVFAGRAAFYVRDDVAKF